MRSDVDRANREASRAQIRCIGTAAALVLIVGIVAIAVWLSK